MLYNPLMAQAIITGILLGWGAAIPIGPLNLEIIRRNLHYGIASGIALGFGACSGDVTYLILLLVGALTILTHTIILKVFGIVGAGILTWFGYQALKMKVGNESHSALKKKPLWRHYLEGYALVLVNPYTVLFWISVSSQIALYAQHGLDYSILMGFGVILGVTSWAVGLNVALHHTKHKLSMRTMLWFNRMGGIIILGFAVATFARVLYS